MKTITADSYQRRINRVLQFIVEHLDEPLPLEKLAAVAHLSPFHFHRIFHGLTGESVAGLVRRLRLQRAGFELCEAEKSITEIALNAGYGSAAAFSRSFRQLSGLSPSDFRRSPISVARVAIGSGVHYDPARGTLVLTLVTGVIPMNTRIETFPEMTLACIRHHGSYHEVGPVFERVIDWVKQRGLYTSSAQIIGLPYDNPDSVPVKKLRYDAGVTLEAPVNVNDAAIKIERIPAGRYAVYTYKGPYTGIAGAFDKLFGQWLPNSGEEPDERPCMEIYLNDCKTLPESEWLTDLCIPLKA